MLPQKWRLVNSINKNTPCFKRGCFERSVALGSACRLTAGNDWLADAVALLLFKQAGKKHLAAFKPAASAHEERAGTEESGCHTGRTGGW